MTPAPRPSIGQHARILARATDFEWLLTYLHQSFGTAVDLGFGKPPMRLTYVFGQGANRFVLADGAHNFTWSEAFDLTKFLIGDTALLVSDGDDHSRRRRLVQPAFARRRLDAKFDIALDEIDTTLARWTAGRSIDAYAELRRTVRRISVRTIFGDRFGDRADEIGDALAPALRYFTRSPATRFDIDLKSNAYGRAVRARRATDVLILEELAKRRRTDGPASGPEDSDDGNLNGNGNLNGDEGFSILDAMLEATDEQGRPLSDEEICDQVRGLVAAGYDTTSSAAAWLVQLLGAHPTHLADLREQVMDTLGYRRPTVDDLRGLSAVDAVVSETLRVRPPAPVGLRMTACDVEIGGYSVPEGTMVVHSPYITHRLEEFWDRPTEFDPTRWDGADPAPYTYVPFGAGARKCIGFALATLELQALVVRLAQKVSWRIDDPAPRSTSVANFAPRRGIPITID